MKSKAVQMNGKQVLVPEAVLVEFGLNEGQSLNQEQTDKVVKATARYTVAKPNPDHLPGCPH